MNNIFDSAITEFFLLHKEYLVKVLDQMPLVKAGHHGENQVFRLYYDDHHSYKEITSSSNLWDSTQMMYLQRAKIGEMLAITNKIISSFSVKNRLGSCSIINTSNAYDSNFFDSLKDSSCSVENKTNLDLNSEPLSLT